MDISNVANTYSADAGTRGDTTHDAAAISGRIERLPLTRWHMRVLGVVGFVHMTDAFDALTIAFVMPVLMGLWHLSASKAGLLVSAGYVGQTIGALLFSMAAERFGRVRALRWLLAVLALGSLASAYAPGYLIFILLRFFQGIGLGGESPVSATYMNEVCPAKLRGRLIFVLQSSFAVGNLIAAIVAVRLIPAYGWQVMFLIGALPLVLAAVLPYIVPESPRWLVTKGRFREAETIVAHIEQTLPAETYERLQPVRAGTIGARSRHGTFATLFRHGLAKRTFAVWSMACCASLTTYGILVWLPSLYRSVYHLPLVVSLRYGMVSMIATVLGTLIGIVAIDWLGRKKTFSLAFLGAALPMSLLAFSGTHATAVQVAIFSSVSVAMIAIVQCGVYVYAPEVYPTSIRARGAGAASAWTRIASVVGPVIIGGLLTHSSIEAVFGYFAVVSLVGAFVIAWFAPETVGRTLDDISAESSLT